MADDDYVLMSDVMLCPGASERIMHKVPVDIVIIFVVVSLFIATIFVLREKIKPQ